MSRLVRFSGYLSWSVADQVVSIGATRLLLFPVLWRLMGDEAFGQFVVAVGLIHMVSTSPSHGFGVHVIREAHKYRAEQLDLLMRTMLLLSLCVALPVSCVFAFGASALSAAYSMPLIEQFLPFLAVFLLLWNLSDVMLSRCRVMRDFRRLALIHALQAGLLFLAIPLYSYSAHTGVGIAYVVAGAGALATVLVAERKTYFSQPYFSRALAGTALLVWLPFSTNAFMRLSQGYLDRLVLGWWWDGAEVTAFFAAAATSQILVAPTTQLSTIILSLLGKVGRIDRFSRRFYVTYLAGVCGAALLLFVVGCLLGDVLLSLLYPAVKERALPLWYYVVAARAILTVQASCQPFIIKFVRPRLITACIALEMVLRIVPLLLLVPAYGRLGAAQALMIGSALATAVSFVLYLKSFVFGRKVLPTEVEPSDHGE